MFLLRTLLAQGSLQIAARRGTPALYGGGAPLVRLYLHRDLPWQPWRRPECRLIEAYRRHHLTIVGGTLRDLHYLFYLNRAASERNLVWQAMLWLERLAYPASLDRMIELDRMFGFHSAASCRLARRRDGGRSFRLRRSPFRGALRVRRRASGRPGKALVTATRDTTQGPGRGDATRFGAAAARTHTTWPGVTNDATPITAPRRGSNRRGTGHRGTGHRLVMSARRPRLATCVFAYGWTYRPSHTALLPSDRWVRIEAH